MGGWKDKKLWKNPNHDKVSAKGSIPSSVTASKKVTDDDDETIPKLKSALKGRHTRRTKLRVKWAPDVYDPPASLNTKTRRGPNGALVLRTFNTSTVVWETGGPSGESDNKRSNTNGKNLSNDRKGKSAVVWETGGPSGESDNKRSNTNSKNLSNDRKGKSAVVCETGGPSDESDKKRSTTNSKNLSNDRKGKRRV